MYLMAKCRELYHGLITQRKVLLTSVIILSLILILTIVIIESPQARSITFAQNEVFGKELKDQKLNHTKHAEDLKYLLEIVNDLDGKIQVGTVEAVVDQPNTRTSLSEMEQIVNQLADKLKLEKIDENYSIKSSDINGTHGNKSQKMVMAKAGTEKLDIQIVMQTVLKKGTQDKSFILLRVDEKIQNNEEPKYLQKYYEKFDRALLSLEENGEFTTCLSGFLNDKLSEDKQKKIMSKLFEKEGISIKEQHETYNEMIFTGYSSKMDNLIMAGDERLNLSIALANERGMDMTSFRIATPLVYSDY
ncbi:YwmB family TATA-box binding protein [Natranaerobius thermophilus]|uniref:TATA-box binding protein n=1 Tax=Natranaerobius thermophilus (strain ATCC BAA-1301 / DSM 18059 / JW/NM-WN-LF) TaxID=457570 RepID=B2A3F9_NATTJ|nr:YwmB family TATA-box binding protein [Natranaerobius thermophilus]ACB86388.1 hypothetical protein Nther_2841 [Natranaerobius thermophilus JW/NM-WN-LF]